MRVSIKRVAYYLPEQSVSNRQLQDENPAWDMGRVEARTGVLRRYIAQDHQTALDLAVRACEQLLHDGDRLEEIDGLIFCTQSEDYIMPPNSCILHQRLHLSEQVLAFDLNLACSGFVYGLALAQGLVQARIAKSILLVTADTYSKYIHKQDRSTRPLFSDGAAATWLVGSGGSQGMIDIRCATSGQHYEKFMIPAGGCRIPKGAQTAVSQADHSGNVRTLEHIHMDGLGILAFVNSRVPQQVRSILSDNGFSIDDVDLFVFHQASELALNSLTSLLQIKPEKVFRNIREVGNTVSASIPIALKDAVDSGQ